MKRVKVILNTLLITGILFVIFIGLSIYTYKNPEKAPQFTHSLLTKDVEQHRNTVEKYADHYDVTEYTDVLLAMMMQESGGRGNDPMQSSESLCGQVGCIDEPEQSIKQGVSYFADTLKRSDHDLHLAIQSYNFGIGFIDFVQAEANSYTEELAIEFSQKMYDNAEDKSIYTCLRKEAKQYDACYGDIYYVRDVLTYRKMFSL